MSNNTKLYNLALGLSIFTIIYNIIEGGVAVFTGAQDEALTLFGFGLDSVIEVVSGIGILLMIRRIKQSSASNKSAAEVLALRITGVSFFVLIGVLLLSAGYTLIKNHHPITTRWGVIISVVSIVIMLVLARLKIATGNRLASKPIIADGKCTMVCVYMSVILLASSLLYQYTHLAYIDALGCLGLCYFCYSEGKEALEGARQIEKTGCC